jgi:signal transduction histidine kinase/CheY-like chemotaxis protein
MKLSKKVFLAIFFTSISLCFIISTYLINKFRTVLIQEFEDRYSDMARNLANSLVQSERLTDQIMLNAAYAVKSDLIRHPRMSEDDLRQLRNQLYMSEIYLISNKGRYELSTDDFAKTSSVNFFDFCGDYKGLANGKILMNQTPILLAYPPNNEKPYKFTQIPSANNEHIIEVGVHLDFIQKIIEGVLKGDTNISSVALYAPSGDKLGYIRHNDGQSDEVFAFESNIPANSKECCQCKVKKLTTGGSDYFYRLRVEVLKKPLQSKIIHYAWMTAILTFTAIMLALIISFIVTRKIVFGIEKLSQDMRVFSKNHELNFRFKAATTDEVSELVANINEMISVMNELQIKSTEAEKANAIAQTTQMLAHDVRRPFSMLRMALNMIGGAKEANDVKKVLNHIVPEIDKAISSVDGMIADVMEVGSTSIQLIQEPVSPEALIASTLRELIRIYPASSISFKYDFKHRHMVNVHVEKISRLFSNVIGNAFQAISGRGEIWISTLEIDEMLEFRVGNSGTLIPPENLPKLFETFFTSGKKGGTGLGLAIAQKVVHAHGGKIRCESAITTEYLDGYVEFIFTLPCAKNWNTPMVNLPQHSSDIARQLGEINKKLTSMSSIDQNETTLEHDILNTFKIKGRPLCILIVDDEAIYRNSLASYLMGTNELCNSVEVRQVEGSDSALQLVAMHTFDLIITDVDMGIHSSNGFDLVHQIRTMGSMALICIHSNRIVASDHKRAIEAGAEIFIPKPMARAQLLRLILQSYNR